METELANTITMYQAQIQYDKAAKELLGNKKILACILIYAVEEFKGMTIDEVVPLIEGDPIIGKTPLEPGLTNALQRVEDEIAITGSEEITGCDGATKGAMGFAVGNNEKGQKIVGLNTENAELNEGVIYFDVLFYVRMRDGLKQMIVNVEAQKDEPTGYDIINRAVFYVSRLISSQKERDFTEMHFNDMKPAYSIWICMNQEENSLEHIHLSSDKLLGNGNWKGNLDLINIVMIGLSKELPDKEEELKLHRLLGALFSQQLTAKQRLGIIEDEYIGTMEKKEKEVYSLMCNLSQGIKEEALAEGMALGEAKGMALGEAKGMALGRSEGIDLGRMYILISQVCKKIAKGKSVEVIAENLEEEPGTIQRIYETAKDFAPDYDVEQIYKALKE